MSIEDMTTEQRALVQAAYNNGRRDGWRSGVDELVRILWSEQEVLVVGHNEDSVDEARVYAKPGHTIDDAGKVSRALALAVPAGCVRDENGVDYKVKFRTPAGSPSPVDNSAPCVQFYCEAASSALSSTEKWKVQP